MKRILGIYLFVGIMLGWGDLGWNNYRLAVVLIAGNFIYNLLTRYKYTDM